MATWTGRWCSTRLFARMDRWTASSSIRSLTATQWKLWDGGNSVPARATAYQLIWRPWYTSRFAFAARRIRTSQHTASEPGNFAFSEMRTQFPERRQNYDFPGAAFDLRFFRFPGGGMRDEYGVQACLQRQIDIHA